MEEAEARRQLKSWIVGHAKNPPGPGFNDQSKILEEGILSSLDIVEFVLYIESLRGEEIDTDDIDPEVFTNIDALYQAFFVGR